MMRLGDLLARNASHGGEDEDLRKLIETELVDDVARLRITGLSVDSRTVSPGFLFIALSGAQADGADYMNEAVKAGAVAILVDKKARAAPEKFAVPLIKTENPRRALALMAARFYPRQPKTIVAVTGTAGKTSLAHFATQIFKSAGFKAASIGTLGIIIDGQVRYGGLTTPDPVFLHQTLDRLARDGVTHVALEASSHGLHQHRLDGVRLTAAAFTNLGRDHMDYHPDEMHYFNAKARLFAELLPKGAPMVSDVQAPFGDKVAELGEKAGLRVMHFGGSDIRILKCKRAANAEGSYQDLTLSFFGQEKHIRLPLPGEFQASNALMAAGLAIAVKIDPQLALMALETLEGVPGRLEQIEWEGTKSNIYIDYAHKPEALASTLKALRPYARRLLIVVFGAGGDRDKGKRVLMGEQAHKHADLVIVTDDNPRSENPADIRAGILKGAPRALNIGDRAEAIHKAVAIARAEDVVVIAGKGHETGQIIGTQTIPFSDHEIVAKALAAKTESRDTHIARPVAKPDHSHPLWTLDELQQAMAGRVFGSAPGQYLGVSIDSRTTKPGDIFFAIKGEHFDGHDFVAKAFLAGACLAVVSEDKLPALGRSAGPVLVVEDVFHALQKLAVAARVRSQARIVAITGSVGKTSTKQILATGLRQCGYVHAAIASYNNHWGVPLTLARMPREAEYGVFEIGMNHAGEIEPLVKMVRPHVAVITTIAPVHLGFFKNITEIAAAKAEIFTGLEPDGVAILNRQNRFYNFLKKKAEQAGIKTIFSFGTGKNTEAHIKRTMQSEESVVAEAMIRGKKVDFEFPTMGQHFLQNVLGVLLAVDALGANAKKVAKTFADFQPLIGRGARHELDLPNGSCTLIDESYNANPASMAAALDFLGSLPKKGRRIAVLGDMLELGNAGAKLHAQLKQHIDANDIDKIYLCGDLMQHLRDVIEAPQKVFHASSAADLMAPILAELSPGDTIMIKGSLATKMATIVDTLNQIFTPHPVSQDQTVTKGS